MKIESRASRRVSWARGLVLAAAVPLGLIAGCGSKPASTSSTPAVGGGPSSGTASSISAAAPVLNSVRSSVPGLSSSQTATGVGSLLGLAQAKMTGDQFAQVSKAVPDTEALIGGAQKAGLPSSGLTGLSSLNGVFDKAGITPTQVSQMIPALGNTISQSAGPSVGQAFVSAVR